jgi:peptide-methionine (S)-S-oxide reductase
LRGVYRTRVGYAGGTKENPTYRSLGDHTETLQIDFDPEAISYKELSKIYWESHNPCYKEGYRQYMSIVFYHDDEQKKVSEEYRDYYEERYGKVYTELVPFEKFYMAENYHQKYYLQLVRELSEDYKAIYPDFKDFINSTSAARVNGYARGYGFMKQFNQEKEILGLSNKAIDVLSEIIQGYGK